MLERVMSVSARLLICTLLALTLSVGGQECPVAVGDGCDQIWLLAAKAGSSGLPGNFRSLPLPGGAFVGESGSAQPSAGGYEEMRKWMGREYQNVKNVWVFDLRQESHAFVDGRPVT
jgi:hypothetical protein